MRWCLVSRPRPRSAYSSVLTRTYPSAVRMAESSFGGLEDTQVCEPCKEKVDASAPLRPLDGFKKCSIRDETAPSIPRRARCDTVFRVSRLFQIVLLNRVRLQHFHASEA
jgi:hypothetical protein